MALWRKAFARRLLLFLSIPVLAVVLISSRKYLTSGRPPQVSHPFFPKPPLLIGESHFACLESQFSSKARRRLAVLHGPDWEIESVITPRCLPEHELIFSMEEGRRFLPRPIVRRLRFWITKKDDRIYVKSWDSAGSEQLDETVLELLTNHQCRNRESKNCRVLATRSLLMRID
jgi:hypothetical protein